MTEPRTLSIAEAAQILGVARSTAYAAAAAGDLPVVRLGRRLVVPRARLQELLGELPVHEAEGGESRLVESGRRVPSTSSTRGGVVTTELTP
jgi:excisionase family DNA binding protein